MAMIKDKNWWWKDSPTTQHFRNATIHQTLLKKEFNLNYLHKYYLHVKN